MWERIKASRVLGIIIVVAIVIAVLYLLGIGFHGSVSKDGGEVGFTHKS